MDISTNNKSGIQTSLKNGNNNFTIQAILLLFLSYGIAFIVTSTIHELGHVIVHLIKGSPISRFVIHPFLMSYVSVADISMEGFENHIAGTLLDLLVCLLAGKILWKNRSTSTFPLLTLVPIALIMEGFNISTGPISPGSDFYLIMEFTGLPAILFFIIGIGLICFGIFFFMPLFPLLGIAPEGRKSTIFSVILPGFLFYNVLLFTYSYLFGTAEFLFYRANNFLIMGGLLAVITAILYSTLYRKSYRKLSYGLQTEKGGVAWKDLQIPGLLFIVIVVFGLIFFN